MRAAIVTVDSLFGLNPVASMQKRERCSASSFNGASNPNCEVSLACVGAHKTRGERMTCLDDSFKPRAMVQLAPQDNGQ